MKYVFLALTNPVPGREDAFNSWYSDSHLREVVQYGTGMLGGRRFRITANQRPVSATTPWEYLAWYDLDSNDLAEYHRKPWIPNHPALVPFAGLISDGHVAWVYEPLGAPVGDPAIIKGKTGEGRVLFFALTNAGEGQEKAFNDWYDRHHVPEVLANMPGFVAGQRYRAAAAQRANQPALPWRYLAVYEVEASSGDAVTALSTKSLTKAPDGVLDPNFVAWVFEPVSKYYLRVP